MMIRYAPAKTPTRTPIRMADANSAARLDIRISGYATQHDFQPPMSGKTWVAMGRNFGKDWASFGLAFAVCNGAISSERWRSCREAIQRPISHREGIIRSRSWSD